MGNTDASPAGWNLAEISIKHRRITEKIVRELRLTGSKSSTRKPLHLVSLHLEELVKPSRD